MNICIGCGLCCDGSIHAQVKLKDGDDPADLASRGFRLFRMDSGMAFSQPCHAAGNGCCTVYEHRPSICRRYRCKLRRRYDAEEVTAQDATAIIRRVQALELQTVLRPALEAIAKVGGSSISDLLRKVHKEITSADDPRAMRRQHSALLVRAKGAVTLVIKHFVDRPTKTTGMSPE